MVKKLVIIAFLMVICFSVFATGFDNAIGIGFFIPENTVCIMDSISYDFNFFGSFFAGPYIGLGESLRLYKTESSKALLYGPAVDLGLEFGKSFKSFAFGLKGGAQAVYSQFPTVLWFDAGVFCLYDLTDFCSLEADFILLFWQKELSFEFRTGVRFCL